MSEIKIIHATEGNLKNISLEIPKNKLVVFTGLSGSGKSTLLVDVLFNECQRQYLEAMSMQGIHKPKVERIQGISPAIVISQNHENRNPRSTVGTMTDVYTDLRMIYEKLSVRICPFCGKKISSADCREETEKIDNDFYVYMYCSECGKRMDKLTRTEFSFNTREGACPKCEGLGTVHRIRESAVADASLSLEDGAIKYWEKQYGKYQISVLYAAYRYYGIPIPEHVPVEAFSELQKAILYHGVECEQVKTAFPEKNLPKTVAAGRFEGVYPILWRRFAEKEGDLQKLEPYFETAVCPECMGERLAEQPRNATVNGTRLPELAEYSLEKLGVWIEELECTLPERNRLLVEAYLRDIRTKIRRILKVGLGYLSLDRQIITLSGGEMQRLRLAAVLDSDLSGMIYILDEPTAGLHPGDTAGLVEILRKLRDLENTVLVIEHDIDVMAAADYIVDMGPGAGRFGGEIVAAGTLDELLQKEESVTGSYLRSVGMTAEGGTLNDPIKETQKLLDKQKKYREATGNIQIKNADKYNLQNIDVEIPNGCITAITGPSGSGKSTLVFEVLAKAQGVRGLDKFDKIVEIEQSSVTKMKRSNVATFSGVYSEIRNVFAKTQAAKDAGLTAKHFSFNTSGGRCENCEGLGYVESNMLFFLNTEVVCPVCGGNQFHKEVLAVKYKEHSIKEVLNLSVDEAAELFADQPKTLNILKLLRDVGLGYLELGQSLTTLSGGECQRLKLAKELIEMKTWRSPAKTGAENSSGKKNLYLMDEPTTGLHPWDVEHFLKLLDRLADAGNTVIVVEHNRQFICRCDWVIDLGPSGGAKGGRIMYEGRPENL